MIRANLIMLIINFFDYFQQRKIYKFLKKKLLKDLILFDVGAHHGETIKNFKKHFDFLCIHSFEASKNNFDILKKKIKKLDKNKIHLNNFGLSDYKKKIKIKQLKESSSSTISNINQKSKYYKRKLRILGLENEKNFYTEHEIELLRLDDYCIKKNIKKIDLLKIDTEGHEYFILKGSTKTFSKIKYIYFEHHYDDMLDKMYTYSNIHDLLKIYKFKKIYKSKMFFRKTFEYIYENSEIN